MLMYKYATAPTTSTTTTITTTATTTTTQPQYYQQQERLQQHQQHPQPQYYKQQERLQQHQQHPQQQRLQQQHPQRFLVIRFLHFFSQHSFILCSFFFRSFSFSVSPFLPVAGCPWDIIRQLKWKLNDIFACCRSRCRCRNRRMQGETERANNGAKTKAITKSWKYLIDHSRHPLFIFYR